MRMPRRTSLCSSEGVKSQSSPHRLSALWSECASWSWKRHSHRPGRSRMHICSGMDTCPYMMQAFPCCTWHMNSMAECSHLPAWRNVRVSCSILFLPCSNQAQSEGIPLSGQCRACNTWTVPCSRCFRSRSRWSRSGSLPQSVRRFPGQCSWTAVPPCHRRGIHLCWCHMTALSCSDNIPQPCSESFPMYCPVRQAMK